MVRKLFRVASFLLVLIFSILLLNNVLSFKYGDGIYSIRKFYEQPNNTVDVLVLGSSHAFEDVNTATLWSEFGISSFDLCGSVQPMWNTYYYLKEALKTQNPDVIVLEAYTTTFREMFSDDSRIIKNTFGLKWSRNKLEAINVSTPEDRREEFIWGYTQYHSRYIELSKADFLKNQGNKFFDNWKGFGINSDTLAFERTNISEVIERLEMTQKTEQYYRKIIELSIENNIDLHIIVSPYPGISTEQQAIFNYAEDIAAEYDIPFTNFNLLVDDIGLDYSNDFADTDHLNYRGNQKFTRYLGRMLQEKYSLVDHRGNEKYSSWEDNAQYVIDYIENLKLKETYDIEEISYLLQDDQYILIISVDGYCTTSDEFVRGLLEKIGINFENQNGIYVVSDGDVLYSMIEKQNNERYFSIDKHDILLKREYSEQIDITNNNITFDNTIYKRVGNGINVLVYSKTTEEIVDFIAFDADSDYVCIK